MKRLLLIAAAATFLALPLFSFAGATPAEAQLRVRAGEEGVSVRVGPRVDRHRHRHVRGHFARGRDCRVIKSRTVTPGGRVIIRTREVCR